MRLAASLALFSLASPVLAGEIQLQQPIDCILGDTCFIQQYVDHDAGPTAADFTCGPLSYDGHKGTDFGLPSFHAMRNGVNVLASAAGVVRGLRDGEPDTGLDGYQQGKDCGNGVVIDHGDGWITQYCHMKRGSVTVQQGQRVNAGAVLGEVGYSGRTQFPHLHLSVRKDGAVVDPFDPDGQITCGAPDTDSLWQDRPAYTPGGFLSAGFNMAVPDYDLVKDGSADMDRIPANAPALVVWAYAFGARSGDRLRMEITGPDGAFFDNTVTMEKAQAQFFRAGGKRAPAQGLKPGTYEGQITLLRNGQVIDSLQARTVLQ